VTTVDKLGEIPVRRSGVSPLSAEYRVVNSRGAIVSSHTCAVPTALRMSSGRLLPSGQASKPQCRILARHSRVTLSRAGFTLIELMVVIAIAALLMAIIVPLSSGMSASQAKSECAFNLRTLGQSLLAMRNDYHGFPRDNYEIELGANVPGIDGQYFGGKYGDLSNTGTTAFWTDASNVEHTYAGVVGLYSMYYLTEYATLSISGTGHAPTDQTWFRGGRYLRNLEALHCPANHVKEKMPEVINPPYLGDKPGDSGYNNYDEYYRRDWFDKPEYPTDATDKRNLMNAYPPADTLVTYCPHHRRSLSLTRARSGDEDVVLFADGSVMTLPAYPQDPNNATATMNPAKWFSEQRALQAQTGTGGG
jgi:prepilin-type N-terminal cleavage/methylation domain-containing protein